MRSRGIKDGWATSLVLEEAGPTKKRSMSGALLDQPYLSMPEHSWLGPRRPERLMPSHPRPPQRLVGKAAPGGGCPHESAGAGRGSWRRVRQPSLRPQPESCCTDASADYTGLHTYTSIITMSKEQAGFPSSPSVSPSNLFHCRWSEKKSSILLSSSIFQ